ncbi:hypothetical protein XthCFBP4691_06555 [Xanthomonas theicola]|uniref:Uncharacterized protein n=1 Tax=Xanthomonas theicola TaxID=56464 RepID=A0A2S6ZHE6_9XANT|nr:hypothetical protein XthCFBP4691_06555 [Xanthomonas theicola]QNH26034.1 hypothetical protein G4Q83_16510 [Xanthomonas theicola]
MPSWRRASRRPGPSPSQCALIDKRKQSAPFFALARVCDRLRRHDEMSLHAALPPRSGDKYILSTYLEFTARPSPTQRRSRTNTRDPG